MSYAAVTYTQSQQVILRNVRRYLAGRDSAFTETVCETSVLRALSENPALVTADLLAGKASAIAALLSSERLTAGEDKAFAVSGTVTKALKAAGTVVFSGLPTDGQTVTISDGVHTASVFEMDDGTAAVGTLTFTGVPADTGTVSLSDGTTSKVFEFDTGVLGVASTGGVVTISTGAPSDGDTVTLTTSTAAGSTATVYEFNNAGTVSGSNKAVLTGSSAATAATELIAAINATGTYASNGSTGYTASSGGSGVVNIVRTATGAGNETITKSGTNIAVTTSFSGGVTQVAVGSAITGGRVGVATAATPGGVALSTAQVCTNLIAAIAAVTGPAFLFTATQGAGTTVTLTANTKGTAGNSFTMSKVATNFTVSGATFASGAAAGSGAVTGSNIAVAIGATAALTATALHTAINAAANLDVTSLNGTAGTCTLVNDAGGTAGNVAITKTASNCTVSGMSGGTQVATVTLLSDAAVGARTAFVTGFVARVNGATAWTGQTALVIEDSAGVDFFSIAQAALTNAAELRPGSTNVTSASPYYLGTGGTATKGIQVSTTGATQEIVGSDVQFTVFGVLRNV